MTEMKHFRFSFLYIVYICILVLNLILYVICDEPTKYWAWVSGPSTKNQLGKFVLSPFTVASDFSNYHPGSREGAQTWLSNSRESLFIFGGEGYAQGASKGLLQDLWRFDILTRSWCFLTKSPVSSKTINKNGVYGSGNVADEANIPGSRFRGATWIDDDDGLWLFGGDGYPESGARGSLRDLWWFRQSDSNWIPQNFVSTSSLVTNQNGDYSGSVNSIPGSRYGASIWKLGNKFYLFGGNGYPGSGGEGILNDLWYFESGLWNYVTGATTTGSIGVYNTKGVYGSASSFYPGARSYAASFVSFDQKLYLFGGNGLGSTSGSAAYLNDLWAFDTVSIEWAWISGSDTVNPLPDYGVKGEFSTSNSIGGRQLSGFTSAYDGKSFFVFGGDSKSTDGGNGNHNDLWEFDVQLGQWRWVSGDNTVFAFGNWGTQPYPSLTTVPGIRKSPSVWFSNHTLFLFGGSGTSSNGGGSLNDLWLYDETFYCDGVLFNRTNVCSQQGVCEYPEYCNCNSTHSGNICQYPVCYGVPSSNGSVCSTLGECIAPDNCTCVDGYGGIECEFPVCHGTLSNQTEVCSGHGSCGNPNTCNCSIGYTGDDCEYSICDGLTNQSPLVCSQHGTCDLPDLCTCEIGYTGSNCEFPICYGIPSNESYVCESHGVCESPDDCNCNSGYNGDQCQYAICYGISGESSTVCSTHGNCTSPNTCNCETGYDGNQCQYNICYGILSNNAAVCSTHGTCTQPDTCECDSGYFGEECSFPICFGYPSNDSNVCSTNGTCISPNTCVCDSEHGGSNCEYPYCFSILADNPNVCSTYGDCIDPNNCVCDIGHFGEECELFDCFGFLSNDTSVCSSHGICSFVNTCVCSSGYTDIDCSKSICFGILSNDTNVCSSHGNCSSPNICECYSGFAGPNCQYFDCFGTLSNETSVCSTHGDCLMFNHCICHENYYGDDCNVTICNGVFSNNTSICSGHGLCSIFDSCECQSDYTGNNCQYPICFELPSNDLSVCSGHGDCINPDNCSCNIGYHGQNCSIIECYEYFSNDTSVCSGHGECVLYQNCSCVSGFHGDNCNIPECFGILGNETESCSSHGNCSYIDTCDCNYGYYSSNCSIIECHGNFSNSTDVCSSHGDCISPNHCHCDDYYWGTLCDTWSCFGKNLSDIDICSSHGDCIDHNTCQCEYGYAYYDCSQFACYGVAYSSSLVCSSHGDCLSFDNCDCNTNYFGSNCNSYYCHGVERSDPSVCSGHGTCTEFDYCSCLSGYYGDNCESFDCFNIPYNSIGIVCNGKGDCISPDICSCTDSNYFGEECKNFTCYGVDFYDPNVCNGHGNCILPNSCSCDSNWMGDNCDYPTCFGIPSNDSQVCYGHGICTNPNTCNCTGLYTPPECEIMGYICFNKSSVFDPDTVCSGHGECVATNTCICRDGYSEEDCNLWSFNITPSTGTAFITEFTINLPPDVSSTSDITVSFIHPYSIERIQAIKSDWNKFIMDVEGLSINSYSIELTIEIRISSSSVGILTQSIKVHDLKSYCYNDSSTLLCSEIMSNFVNTYKNSNETHNLRVIESILDAFYDCNNWRYITGSCNVRSISYPYVECYYPNEISGICNSHSCNCHENYTGVDCSILMQDLSGLQNFQNYIIELLENAINLHVPSSSLLNQDLKLTNCVLNDLHDIRATTLTSIVTHLERTLQLSQLFNYESNVNDSRIIFFGILAKLLDFVYLKSITTSIESDTLSTRIYEVTHTLSKQHLLLSTLGHKEFIDSGSIIASFSYDTKENLEEEKFPTSTSSLTLPNNTNTFPSQFKVSYIVFKYNFYIWKSLSFNIITGIHSVRFYDSSNILINVKNLQDDNLIHIDMDGDWRSISSLAEEEGQCVYWDEALLDWSSTGCVMSLLTDTIITCSCNHTTDFSISSNEITDIYPNDPFDWKYIIIAASSLLLLLLLCLILCCLFCLCLSLLILLSTMKKNKKTKKRINSEYDIDYYDTTYDNSGKVLLPDRENGIETSTSIANYANNFAKDSTSIVNYGKDDLGTELDEDSYIIPELKDYLNRMEASRNPSEVAQLNKEIAEIKEKYRRRKELDEMKTYVTTLMAINSPDLARNIKMVEDLHKARYSGDQTKPLKSIIDETIKYNPTQRKIESLYSDFERQAPTILPSTKIEDVKVRSPILKKQIDKVVNDRNKLEMKHKNIKNDFIKLESQYDKEEKSLPQIAKIEKEIDQNFEKINKIKMENGSNQLTSDAIIKLKFQNKLLDEKIHKIAQELGLDPNRTRLRQQIDNLRRQYKNNLDLIHNLEDQLKSKVISLANSNMNFESPDINKFANELNIIENENSLLIKEGNALMKQYFNLKKKNRDWSTIDFKQKDNAYDDYYTNFESNSFMKLVEQEKKSKFSTIDTTFMPSGNLIKSQADSIFKPTYIATNPFNNQVTVPEVYSRNSYLSPNYNSIITSKSREKLDEDTIQIEISPKSNNEPKIQKSNKNLPNHHDSNISKPYGNIKSDTSSFTTFSSYTAYSDEIPTVRSIRGKIERVKNQIKETKSKFKHNQELIERLRSTGGNPSQIGSLELENQLLVQKIADLAKRYHELRSRDHQRK